MRRCNDCGQFLTFIVADIAKALTWGCHWCGILYQDGKQVNEVKWLSENKVKTLTGPGILNGFRVGHGRREVMAWQR